MDTTQLHGPADTFEIAGGVSIPCVGYGTWQAPDDDTTARAVATALRAGYRHIDAAAIYGNERSVGRGIASSGIAREELFVTSKVWNTERGYDRTLAAFERTLDDLGLDYLDLYLIHWPANERQFSDGAEALNRQTWRAMCELYLQGRVRAIGVSNFKPHHLEQLIGCAVPPMVDQVELNPGHPQADTLSYCRANDILVEALSPLGSGRLLSDGRLGAIARRHGVSTAQLCIRWCLQLGVLPLPKSVTASRIRENADVFGFELSSSDMEEIAAIGEFGGSGLCPDEVDF